MGGYTGGIQMYWDIQGVYRCMGAQRCTGAYRCMKGYTGDIWMYGGIQWGTDVWGITQVWTDYRCMENVQMYGGVQMWGHLDPPKHTNSETYHQHACQLHLGTIFHLKFKFNPYRHMLLAYQLA